MLDGAPDRPTAWISTAQTLHGLRQTRDAWEALHSIWEKFPGVPVIPYNLACYACRLGRLHESKRWLRKAFKVGGEKFRTMALSESDLKPLSALINKLCAIAEVAGGVITATSHRSAKALLAIAYAAHC